MPSLLIAVTLLAVVGTLWFSTLSYALRNLSRARLSSYLEKHGTINMLDSLATHAGDLIFITAIGRLASNITILLCMLKVFHSDSFSAKVQYALAVVSTLTITLFFSVAIPSSIAKYAGAPAIGFFGRLLLALRIATLPFTKLMHAVDSAVKSLAHSGEESESEHIEQEILSVVEEGEKDGIVGRAERQMIEAVIRFDDITVNQIMTARPEMIGIDANSSISEIRDLLQQSGHSRLPVYEESLDRIIGVLYARDLLKFLGHPINEFDLHKIIRSAYYVPETKKLRDLLGDFRAKKVHMAIVLDEYGGTSGLVTIEDVLEELVGDISDEHEPVEPTMLKQLAPGSWEADARVYIDEFNRRTGMGIPEDAGFDTLGGYITTSLGRIPSVGETFKSAEGLFTTLDAEPQKINRVRIDIASLP